MLLTSTDFPTALGIILNAQPAKHSCSCFTYQFKYLSFSTALNSVPSSWLEQKAFVLPPLEVELSLLPSASVCVSPQRSSSKQQAVLPNSRKQPWPQAQ